MPEECLRSLEGSMKGDWDGETAGEREGGREGGREREREGVRIRVEPIMLLFNPVILFCNSCHPSLLFLLHAPIIPLTFFSNQLPREIYTQ